MSDVTAAMFRDGKLVERGGMADSMPPAGPSEFIWIEVRDPSDSDFAVLQERFQLHSLAVEDSMTPAHVPKVDLYDDQIFVVLKTARLENDEIRYDEVEAFLSGRHIITVQHGRDADFDGDWGKIRAGLSSRRIQPDFILHAIMDFIVDRYFPVVQMIEEEVLLMEQQILDDFLGREARPLDGLQRAPQAVALGPQQGVRGRHGPSPCRDVLHARDGVAQRSGRGIRRVCLLWRS